MIHRDQKFADIKFEVSIDSALTDIVTSRYDAEGDRESHIRVEGPLIGASAKRAVFDLENFAGAGVDS